ncbi:hypothetical protein HD806DRAFT_434418 [Xylariaceae sp. AK1471]|nr:hypothetical protein HD806DRAFT_434418 [Xylariaceae sp. AK1471]
MIYGLTYYTLHFLLIFILMNTRSIHDSRPTNIQSLASLHIIGLVILAFYCITLPKTSSLQIFSPMTLLHPFHFNFLVCPILYIFRCFGFYSRFLYLFFNRATYLKTDRQPRYPVR